MRLLPASATSNARRVLAARSARAVADGFISVILPAYLLALGLDTVEIGMVATATLLGSALLTLAVGRIAARHGVRAILIAASGLMVATGLAFAGLEDLAPLLVVAFVGTLNPSGGDVSVFLPVEHAVLSHAIDDRDRTALFARYTLVGALAGAFGILIAAVPDLAVAHLGWERIAAFKLMFVVYAALGVVSGVVYRRLAPLPSVAPGERPRGLGPSRRVVYRLAALFSLDAFGGGLFVQSILALWLFQTFGLSLTATASLLFWTNLMTALSYLVAVPLARRIGLINTMVFTHLPSNLCLMAIPFVPDLSGVIALLLVRSLLSQMDVPTRSSYVMAIVTPAERAAAASVTSVPRSLAAAVGPTIAGWLLAASAFAWPLLIGGALKAVYDLALLAAFRHLRPPEERR